MLTDKNGYYVNHYKHFFKRQFHAKNSFLSETKIGQYSKSMKAVVSVEDHLFCHLNIMLMNNSNTNCICTITDLLSTQNFKSKALATCFYDVITMQSQYHYT